MKKVINEELIYEILSVVEEIPKGKVAMYFIHNFCSKIQLKILPCKHE